jgi:anaerobic selenocysteine-containing dehydrogenase
MQIRRREFLKQGAAVGALAMVGSLSPNALAAISDSRRIGVGPGRWIPTTCQGCTTWCPLEVFVQNGRAVKVRGNQHSKQNDGVCCPRGHMGLQQLYDPDRIKVPMKRTNSKKGRGIDPKFVPISWDEALDTIADRILELRNNGEAHKYMLMRGRYSYMRDIIYDGMTKIIGSPNNISHSAICAEGEKFGAFYTEGFWDYRDYDLDKCKYLLAWGCDPVSSNRMVPAAIKRISGVVDRGTVAVVDPKMQTSALKGQEWLPIRPGEDGALAVAIAHTLLIDGLWNREFVGDFSDKKNRFEKGKEVDETLFAETESYGLVKWWNLELKDKTPKWAEKRTGISAKQIVRVARGLGKAAPHAAVWLGPGAAMQVRGAYAAMAIHALNGLLGCVDNEGGTLASMKQPVNKMPKLDAYKDEIAKKKFKKIDQRGTLEFPALKKGKPGSGVVTNNAAQGMLDADPYEIKMAIGYMNNFSFSCTGAKRWEEALSKLPFYAHITTHVSEMTMFADIVLPSTMTTYEKWGWVKQKQNGYAHASLMQPVVDPLFDVKTDETEVPYLIAEKLAERGFTNLLDFYRNEYKDVDSGKLPESAAEFAEIATKYYLSPMWKKEGVGGDKIGSWDELKKRGMWNSDKYPYKKRWGHFKTETHKFEFYSETLKKALNTHAEKHKVTVNKVLEVCKYTARDEQAFIPHYEEPFRWGSREEYPFTFVDFKSRLNREGRSANAKWYMEFKKLDPGDESWDDVLKINPKDAKKLGLKDGDMARLTSVTGEYLVKVKTWEGVVPGVVTKCYGQGHWAYGRVASQRFGHEARGVNNNEIMPADYDRLSGSTARNGGFTGVRIEKV